MRACFVLLLIEFSGWLPVNAAECLMESTNSSADTDAVAVFRCEQNAVSNGSGLVIDSASERKEFGWRRYAYLDDADLFEAGGRYRITFRCKVEARDPSAFLLVLVRPLSWNGNEKDVFALSVDQTKGEWKTFSANVDAGCEKDYRLQFHSRNRIKAEIADLRVEKRPPLVFKAATADTPRFTGDLGPLPTGAKEFDVDLPRKGTGLVLSATDFGVSETNDDNTVALRAAFAAAKERNAERLDLAKGVYRLNADAPLALDDYRDFTFDGHGSTLVSHRNQGAFLQLRRCERTRLMNFCVDWDWTCEPLASLIRVKRTDARSYDLEFVDYVDFPNKEARLVVLSAYDPKTHSVGIEDGLTRYLDHNKAPEDRVKRTWLNGNTVRIEAPPTGIAVGQLYRLQHFYYHMHGFRLNDNAHLRLENVTVLSTPGHAFVMGGRQHHTLFDHVSIVAPKDDPKRVITCTADHLHIAQSCGFIKLENCEFSLGADDIMNMHDCTAFARRIGPHTVRAQNAWIIATARKSDRIEIRNGDYSPTGFIGTLVSVKRVAEGRNDFDVTFKEEVPSETKDGFVLFNWAYDTHNVIVRNCHFHDNRARGLLILARDVTVEKNVFRHQEMGAIKIETGYTHNLWSEGYGVSNVVIRNNLFDNTNPSGSNGGHRERTIYAGIYLKTDPSTDTTDYPILRDILITRNRFRDNCGVTAYLSSVRNVTVYQNLIEDPTPRRKEKSYRSQFYLTHAADVRIIDNVYHQSPNVHAPGVVWDSETCSGIVAEGNRACEGKFMRIKLR